MNNKISFIQNIKDYFRDIKIHSKDRTHNFIRHKVKIGYKTPKDHAFIPDQSKLGMHVAVLDPDSLIVEDIMTTNPKFGNLLKMRPIFIEINHEQKDKINLNEGQPWIYNEDEKDFFQFEDLKENNG